MRPVRANCHQEAKGKIEKERQTGSVWQKEKKTAHVVVLALLFDYLLSYDIPRTKQYARRSTLGDHGPALKQRALDTTDNLVSLLESILKRQNFFVLVRF